METHLEQNIKAIVVDDEPASRQLISTLLSRYCKGVKLVGQAGDANEGIDIIIKSAPQIVFLDIEMPGNDGFELLDAFPSPEFKVIFITGHDEYAIKAIKYAALDYLLKPIQLPELQSAVNAAGKSLYQNRQLNLFRELYHHNKRLSRMALPGSNQYDVLTLDNILRIRSNENYVSFHMKNGQEYMASHHLQYYEDLLPGDIFFRIHRSCIVNLNHVIQYDKGKGGNIFLSDNSSETVSYRRKPDFLRAMQFIG